MGDLPGSPSVAPSPLFCAARRGQWKGSSAGAITPALMRNSRSGVLDGKLGYVLRVYLVLRRGATYISIYNGISRTRRSLEH
jgi:hypothetical protein